MTDSAQHDDVQNRNEKLSLAGVLALTFLTFASTFTFGWVYDDPPQIPGNPDLRWDRLGFLFTHQLWASASGIGNARFYRPFLTLWFLINKTVFGLNPHWFHVTSVLAHLMATALAFFIARRILKDTPAALLAAAVFAIHPLQVESASWISAVNDPLAAVFCFGSFLAYKKYAESDHPRSWASVSVISFFCALLTKEVSIVLPIIVAADYGSDLRSEPAPRRHAFSLVWGGCIVAIVVWFSIRYSVLPRIAQATQSVSKVSVLLTAPRILLFQLGHVILPWGLSPHYEFRAFATTLPNVLLASCIAVILLVAFIFSILKIPSPRVAFAWLILPLLPSLNARWLNEDDFVHDRYMYMSMLGVALLVGVLFAALKKRWQQQRLIPGLAFAIVIGLAFASAIQSQFWANDVALFARGVQIAPQNEWAQLDYGAALSAQHKFAEASPYFVKSYQLKPGWRAAQDAGFAFANSLDLEQADYWYAQALRLNPSLAGDWLTLGQIRLAEHGAAAAIPLLQKAIALNPDGEGYHCALGSALEQAGQRDAALNEYHTELRLHPSQLAAQQAIARLNALH
jgi:protein O-mannosyl-transferase